MNNNNEKTESLFRTKQGTDSFLWHISDVLTKSNERETQTTEKDKRNEAGVFPSLPSSPLTQSTAHVATAFSSAQQDLGTLHLPGQYPRVHWSGWVTHFQDLLQTLFAFIQST